MKSMYEGRWLKMIQYQILHDNKWHDRHSPSLAEVFRTRLTTKLMNHDACILDAMMMKTMKPPDALQPMKMRLMLPDVLPLMT